MIAALLTLWISLAGAAPVGVSVRGVVDVKAVAVVFDDGSGPVVLSCQDNGAAPDAAVDGSWTCQALETTAEKVWLAVVTDTQISKVGAAILSGSDLVIEQIGQGARLLKEPGPLEVQAGAISAGPGAVLITRVNSPGTGQAPMLLVETPMGQVEHSCSDDGRAFDQFSNDEVYLCSGLLPGGERAGDYDLLVSMRQEGEKAGLAKAVISGAPGVVTLTVDAVGDATPILGGFSLWVRPGAEPVAAPDPSLAAEPEAAPGGVEEASDTGGQAQADPVPEAVQAEDVELEDPAVAQEDGEAFDTGECLDEPESLLVTETEQADLPEEKAAPEPEKAKAPKPPKEDPIEAVFDDIALVAQREPVKQTAKERGRSFSSGVRTSSRGGGMWRFLALVLAGILGLSWLRRRMVHPIPPDLEPVGTPRMGRIGPRAEGDSIQVRTRNPEATLRALVEHLSSHRRVVLLGVGQLPEDLRLAYPVYTLRTSMMLDALASVEGLTKAAGPPVVVLVVDASRLEPGSSLSPAPLAEFFEALDALVWSAVFSSPDSSPRPELVTWSQSEEGRWRRE